MGDSASAAVWPKWFGWLLALALALTGLANFNIQVDQLARDTGLIAKAQPSGLYYESSLRDRADWYVLGGVDPKSPLANAGMKPGDLVHFDLPLNYKRVHVVGSTVGFVYERSGEQTHLEHTYRAAPPEEHALLSALGAVLRFAALLITAGLGLVLIWRRWGDPAALLLGLVIFSTGVQADGVPIWSHSIATDFWFYVISNLPQGCLGLFPLFCHYLASGPDRRIERRVAVIWAVVFALVITMGSYEVANQRIIWALLPPGLRNVLAWLITFVLAVVILARNYRRNDPAQRNRIRIIAAAFAVYTLGLIAGTLFFVGLIEDEFEAYLDVLLTVTQVAAPVLFVYAMLRHKLFDFNFAVNRTLVYATVSFILLAGFGLAEWAVEHLIPEEWHKAGPLWSAGIALGLFLIFHRIRDFVEHHIEGLFFRSWQRKEEALNAFVSSASYFEDAGKLASATVEAFRQFAGTDQVALYWRGPGEFFESLPGSGAACPARIEADDPALVRARHDRAAVSVRGAGSLLAFDLVLPIIEHGRLCGLIAVGDKPDAPSYRPDEIEIMAASARLVGLDLLAIRAQSLEQQVAGLNSQVAWFRQVLTDLLPKGDARLTGPNG